MSAHESLSGKNVYLSQCRDFIPGRSLIAEYCMSS